MRSLFVNTGLSIRRTLAATGLAVALLLSGCAVGPSPGTTPTASACGMGAVLYCDLNPPNGTCHCARHNDLRDAIRSISLR